VAATAARLDRRLEDGGNSPLPAKTVAKACRHSPTPAVQSKPQLLVWITCDAVHIDPSSGKHTLLGVFSSIKARQFPVTHPLMIWFLTLTDCSPGKHLIKISVGLDMEHMQPVIQRDFESQSPLHRINLINEMRNCRFEQPGDYSILIEVDDEPLLVTSMSVSS
jgi:hypothetical protein